MVPYDATGRCVEGSLVETRIDEIADNIYRISTFAPVGPGLAFNQFLIDCEEPLLFHTGFRHMFADISAAVRTVIPLEKLRWIGFSHLEADECGAMNHFLAAAPDAQIVHGEIGTLTSLSDLADRPPRTLQDGDVLPIGSERRVRLFATPHVPHGWDAVMLYEEATRTLFASDLFTAFGNGPVLTDGDIVAPAIAAENAFPSAAITPLGAPTLRRLGGLGARTMALMHAPAYHGDVANACEALALDYEARLASAIR
jgi:flavorubredoxin